MSQETLRMVYFPCLHSVMKCGIILWGNSPYTINIFRIQKRIIIIITNSTGRVSCSNCLETGNFTFVFTVYIYIYPIVVCSEKQGSLEIK
jgi:hypothetical protein